MQAIAGSSEENNGRNKTDFSMSELHWVGAMVFELLILSCDGVLVNGLLQSIRYPGFGMSTRVSD